MSVDRQLADCGALVFDIEIISAVPQHGELRQNDLHYCKGWDDYAGMGISMVSAYDFVDGAYRIFLADNLSKFGTLVNSRNVIIGFNNDRFDNNVLAANDIEVPQGKSYDLWKYIVATVPPNQRRGYALADMLRANGIGSKSGLGADAPRLVQTGQWGAAINYCLDDTRLTVGLLRLACSDLMKSPKTGDIMIIKKPWELVGAGLFTGG